MESWTETSNQLIKFKIKKAGEKEGKQTSTVALSSEKRLHNQQACPRRPDSQERTHGGKKQRGGKRGKRGMMDVDEGMRRTVRRVSRPADGESKRSACVRACRSSPPVTALS